MLWQTSSYNNCSVTVQTFHNSSTHSEPLSFEVLFLHLRVLYTDKNFNKYAYPASSELFLTNYGFVLSSSTLQTNPSILIPSSQNKNVPLNVRQHIVMLLPTLTTRKTNKTHMGIKVLMCKKVKWVTKNMQQQAKRQCQINTKVACRAIVRKAGIRTR